MQRCQVLVVGCGPVGAVLAGRLAQLGLSAVVVERAPTLFPQPRAVAADDEVQLLLSRLVPSLPVLGDQSVRFVSPSRVLGEVRFPGSHGFSGLAFFHQPTLEMALRELVPDLRLGVALESWLQSGSGVTARLSDGTAVHADWLVGCDGASSVVRRTAGISWRGRDLPARWLVADVVETVPERQRFTYTCDPAMPQVDLPVPGGHRWEWLLRPGAGRPDLLSDHPGLRNDHPGRRNDHPGLALALLRRDTDATVEVVRAVEYGFGARRASTWRAGRVLLAGDAAHTMPPFAGQGLGAGIRDAWALAGLLARGEVERYEPLRAPHVRSMTRLSLALGTVLQAERGARARDAALAAALRVPWVARGGPRSSTSGVADL